MKISTTILVAVFSLLTFGLSAQDTTMPEKRNEIKLNALYMILGAVEIDYERIINEESSYGVSVNYVFEDAEFKWGVMPHYRLFFGKKPAQGFFVEGHGVVFGYEDKYNYLNNDFDETGVATGVGMALGSKFITSRDVALEVFVGLARVFGDVKERFRPLQE